MSSAARIATLYPGVETSSLDIRVIRVWQPHFRSNDCSFLFLDRDGNGIEAVGPRDETDELTQKFVIFGCYRIDDYSCIELSKIQPAINNKNALSIGAVTTAEAIPDDGSIPCVYFDFCNYDDLPSRIKQSYPQTRDGFFPTTDYIGRLDERPVEDVTTTGRPYMRLSLVNMSGQRLQLTLWEEVLRGEDRKAFTRSALSDESKPIIIAATSLQVSRYGANTIQLASTSATYVYVNPDLPVVSELQERYKNEPMLAAREHRHVQPVVGGHKESISALLNTPRGDAQDTVFTVNAQIDGFITGKRWCFTKCPNCHNDISRNGKRWLCRKDKYFTEAQHGYCVAATIKDGESTTTVTLFDDAMRSICGLSCNELIYQKKWDLLTVLPPQIKDTVGSIRLFHVQVQNDRFVGTTSYACNRVDDPTVNASFFKSVDPKTPTSESRRVTRSRLQRQATHSGETLAESGAVPATSGSGAKVYKRRLVLADEGGLGPGSSALPHSGASSKFDVDGGVVGTGKRHVKAPAGESQEIEPPTSPQSPVSTLS